MALRRRLADEASGAVFSGSGRERRQPILRRRCATGRRHLRELFEAL